VISAPHEGNCGKYASRRSSKLSFPYSASSMIAMAVDCLEIEAR